MTLVCPTIRRLNGRISFRLETSAVRRVSRAPATAPAQLDACR